MDTYEIYNCLKKYPIFRGVYPSDDLPQVAITEKPCFLVINLDPSYLEGSHWVSVYLTPAGSIQNSFYLDSYGKYPGTPEIVRFLNTNAEKWSYNRKILQSVFTDTCGYYSAVFCMLISAGKSIQDFLDLFSYNPLLNDVLVCKLYSKRCSTVKRGQFCKSLLK